MQRQASTFGQDFARGARHDVQLPGDPAKQWGALLTLLVLAGLAIAGPWGILSWYESAATLEQREKQIALLEEDVAALENRVKLLDPENVDPDLGGELVRSELGVLHGDEVVVIVPEE